MALLCGGKEEDLASIIGKRGSSLDKNCSPDMHVVRLLSIYRSYSREFLELYLFLNNFKVHNQFQGKENKTSNKKNT